MNKIIKKGLLGLALICESVTLSDVCLGAEGRQEWSMEKMISFWGCSSLARLEFDAMPNVFKLVDDRNSPDEKLAESFKIDDQDGFVAEFFEECCKGSSWTVDEAVEIRGCLVERIVSTLKEAVWENIMKEFKGENTQWDAAARGWNKKLKLCGPVLAGAWDFIQFLKFDSNGKALCCEEDIGVTITPDVAFRDVLAIVSEKLFGKKVEMPLDLNKLFYTMYGRPAEGEVRVIFDGRAVEYVFDKKWDSDLQKKVDEAVSDYNFCNFREYYEDL